MTYLPSTECIQSPNKPKSCTVTDVAISTRSNKSAQHSELNVANVAKETTLPKCAAQGQLNHYTTTVSKKRHLTMIYSLAHLGRPKSKGLVSHYPNAPTANYL